MKGPSQGDLRSEAEGFLRRRAEEGYRFKAGLSPETGLPALYRDHVSFRDPASYAAVRSSLARESDPLRREKLACMADFLAGIFIEARSVNLAHEIEVQRAAERLIDPVDGEEIVLATLDVLIGKTRDREARARRSRLREERQAAYLDPLAQRWRVTQEAAVLLGARNEADLFQEASGIDLGPLAVEAKRILEKTADAYFDLLGWFSVRRLGVRRNDLQRHDLRFLFDEGFDVRPPVARVPVGRIEKGLSEMGLDLSADGRIVLDLDARPTKVARAFVAPIDIPGRIIVVVRDEGGLAEIESFLHEAGHALHFAYTHTDLDWEFRSLGDPTITEAHALVLGDLVRSPRWLKRCAGVEPGRDGLRQLWLAKLHVVRRYSAKFLYEVELWSRSDLTGAEREYAERLSDATGAAYPEEAYLADVDPHFYSARYLRAWMAAAVLSGSLVQEYDEEWYRREVAAAHLRRIWAEGSRPEGPNISAAFGLSRLDSGALIDAILGAFE